MAYRQRKDSEPAWRKDIVLSQGARFAYSPSMSVEADTVVVAWAGSKTAHGWPFEGDPSDIYYATSRDGGKKWARPLKLTDGAKDGVTSGRPQVALLNGVIHLFYVQGKWNNRLQVNDQGSWPIYHQQWAFPK